jgi:hypothetical protein
VPEALREGKNVASLPTARCAAVIQPPPLRSSCKGCFPPPFDPPARTFRPLTRPRFCTSGHRTNPARIGCRQQRSAFAFLTRSLAPWTRAGWLHPRHPRPKGNSPLDTSGGRPRPRGASSTRPPRPCAAARAIDAPAFIAGLSAAITPFQRDPKTPALPGVPRVRQAGHE